MQLGTITRTQIFILIIILELGVAGLFVYFSYMPSSQKITELDNVVKEKTAKVRRIETTKKELKDLENRVAELKKEISRLEQQFKEELFITRTLFLLEQLALATKIDIVSFRPSTAAASPSAGGPAQPAGTAAAPAAPAAAPAANAGQPAPPGAQDKKSAKTFNETQEFKKAVFDLDLMGNFSSLYNFLNELTTFPKLVVVDKIEITQQTQGATPEQAGAPAEQKQSDLLQIKIPLTFYVQKQASLVTIGEGQGKAGAAKNEAGGATAP